MLNICRQVRKYFLIPRGQNTVSFYRQSRDGSGFEQRSCSDYTSCLDCSFCIQENKDYLQVCGSVMKPISRCHNQASKTNIIFVNNDTNKGVRVVVTDSNRRRSDRILTIGRTTFFGTRRSSYCINFEGITR
jgi:hypothetical protein